MDKKHKIRYDYTLRKSEFSIVHGDKSDIQSFLNKEINLTGSYQVIYELMQNANDANNDVDGEGKLLVYYNDKCLLFANNGKPFSEKNIRAICNVGQSDKNKIENKISSGVIGKFGIGFKLTYHLLGGVEQVMNYEAPIIFSWGNRDEIINFLNCNNFETEDIEHPVLFKPVLTAVPIHVDEEAYDLEGTKKILFKKEDIFELKNFIEEKGIRDKLIEFDRGSLFFLKLSDKQDFEKNLENQINEIENSLVFLKYLDEVIIQGSSHKKPENIKIFPESGELSKDIVIAYGSYNDDLKNRPNLYCYFPIADEKHGLNFIIHAPNFEIETSRRSLQWDKEVNFEILKNASNLIKNEMEDRKSDISNYEELLYAILNSNEPERNKVKEYVYDDLLEYVIENIPCKDVNGNLLFKNNGDVVIKDTNLNVYPEDFGIDKYWLYTENEKIDKIFNSKKIGNKRILESYSIVDLINNGDVDKINNWIRKLDKDEYLEFIKELNKKLRKETTRLKKDIKWIKFGDEYLSVEDIKGDYIITLSLVNNKVKEILEKIGIVFSDVDFSSYKDLLSLFFKELNNEEYLRSIHEYVNNHTDSVYNLSPDEKKSLFLWFWTEWGNISEGKRTRLYKLKLFKNKKGEIRELNSLIEPNKYPKFFKDFEIDDSEYVEELNKYLCKEEKLFKTIILDDIEYIVKKSDELGLLMEFYNLLPKYFDKCSDMNLISELKIKKFIKTPNGEFVEPLIVLSPKKPVYMNLMSQSEFEFLHLDSALNKLLEFRIPLKEVLELMTESKNRLYRMMVKKDDEDSKINYIVLNKLLNKDEMIAYLKFLSYGGIKLNYLHFAIR